MRVAPSGAGAVEPRLRVVAVGDGVTGSSTESGLDRFPFPGVATRLRNSTVVPFLGAGASVAGVPEGPWRLPTGAELTAELVAALEPYPGGAKDQLTKVAQFWVDCQFGRADLYEQVRRRFYEDQQHVAPNPTALLLADIDVPLRIVTTNYDNHLEQAMAQRNRDYRVITHVTNREAPGYGSLLVAEPNGRVDEILDRDFLLSDFDDIVLIYKMHGSVTHPLEADRETIIITEDDYIDFVTTSNGNRGVPPRALTTLFQKSAFLFLGYSLEDWNFRVMLRLVEQCAKLGSRRHWAIHRHPSLLEVRFWDHRGVTVFDAPLEDFVDRLRQAYDGLQ